MESFISLFDPGDHTDETDTETASSSDSDSLEKMLINHLPPEPQFGNIEYKLKLTNPSKQRLEHLITQLKWRLNEGNGEAIYEIGVTDSGFLSGLNDVDMNSSLTTLRLMAAELNATTTVVRRRNLDNGKSCVKVVVKKMTDNKNIEEIRISVMGSVDAGKSSLIGVLTQGELDNGRGRARLQMFRHYHEIKSGRTSSISHELLGFDDFGNVINYKDNVTAEEISELSTKLISFMDLAGHRRYMRTTIQAVSGYAPHYIALCVSACYSNGSLNQMTIENLQLIKAFKIPFFVIVTKIDLVSSRDETLQQLIQLLNDVDKLKTPVVVGSMDDLQFSLPDGDSIPIFCVSNVTGEGLDLVQKYLSTLTPNINLTEQRKLEKESLEFHIDEIISHQVPIVGGLLVKGQINEKMKIKLGPGKNGEWYSGVIQSIHRNKFPCKSIKSNQCASVCFSMTESFPALRGGMVLLADNDESSACVFFQATIVVIQTPSIKGIKKGFQNTIHIGSVRQTAVIEGIFGRDSLSANETGSCLFRFVSHPEYIKPGMSLLFRDGRTKGVGCVTQVFPLN